MPKTDEASRDTPSSPAAELDRPTARTTPDTSPSRPRSALAGGGTGVGAAVERMVRALPGRSSSSARPVIVHSHLRWDFVWQRPQQIFSRLAPRHPILFTEEPMRGGDALRLIVTEPHPNVFRAVPSLPAAGYATVDDEWAAVLPMLRDAVASHPLLAGRFDSPIQWFYSPMTAPHFLGRFGASCVVYDCMDELANFRFAPPDIGQRERFLISRADVVFTGGHRLYEAKSQHHDNVHFYGCGVDVAHFATARDPQTPLPAGFDALPRPVFGYFGVIDERIDYELLDRLARQSPDASIVMVGPLAKVERSALPDRPNIHWLGQRRYEDLPAIVKGFDVCLMPFALNEATRFINPTKTLEYMAAGKPIVSTAVPDVVRNFTPIVEVAQDPDGFVDAVWQAYRAPCAELLDKGLERAQRATWDGIVAAMRSHVLEAADSRNAAQAEPHRVRLPSGNLLAGAAAAPRQ
jgi:glycosyltransferase involved in cell wall biosynthesis